MHVENTLARSIPSKSVRMASWKLRKAFIRGGERKGDWVCRVGQGKGRDLVEFSVGGWVGQSLKEEFTCLRCEEQRCSCPAHAVLSQSW